jgi:hypothetical protein
MSKKPTKLRVVAGGKGKAKVKASKAKAAKPEAAAKDDQDAKQSFQVISKRDLGNLTRQCIEYDRQAGRHSGAKGELIREYADKKHLHRGAFAMYCRLVRMGKNDPGKLNIWLTHFDHMRERGELDALAKLQGQLFEDEDESETDAEAATQTETTDAREVEETAGAAPLH